MLLVRGRFLQQQIDPIRIGIVVGILCIVGHPSVDRLFRILRIGVSGTVIVLHFILNIHPIYHISVGGSRSRLVDRILIIIVQLKLTILGSFGGDQDNACRSSRSIDGSRGGIFQDTHRLHIVSHDIVQRTRNTIDNHQRVVRRKGRHATNLHRRRAARSTRRTCHLHAGDLTLHGRRQLLCRALGQRLAVDRRDRTGQVALTSCTITDHYHLIQLLTLFGKGHGEMSVCPHFHLLGGITDVGDLQNSSVGYLKREDTIHIGDRTIGGSLLDNIRTDHGLALPIHDRSRHLSAILLGGGR